MCKIYGIAEAWLSDHVTMKSSTPSPFLNFTIYCNDHSTRGGAGVMLTIELVSLVDC